MADNRKRFRLRRLTFGGSIRPCALLLAVSLALIGMPAQAQDGLKSGAASLSAGKYEAAVRQLSAAINSSGTSTGQAAKALYLRGVAYRKLGQPGRAVSDLGAAIWLGLPADDRVKALVNRGLAYKAAGLGSQAEAEFSQARKLGGSGEVASLIEQDGGAGASTASIAAFETAVQAEDDGPSAASVAVAEPGRTRTAATAPGSWDTSVSSGTQQPSSGSNRLTRWWGSVTGSDSPPPAPPAVAAAPKAAAPTTGWAATTDGAATASDAGERGSGWRLFSRSAEADPTPAPAPAATRASSGGSYRLQFGSTKSEAEANALWKKVSRENQHMAALQPRITKSEIGSFGTFYHLTVGPFRDKAETLKTCNALKRRGVDCFLEGSEEQ
ncbi:SPOR domain-containing protein [Methyloceanibacter sp.]|jgi:cell division septation protein DedD|uniref:SPOR domain-containing protein n=1 Tax=Methyloceanibacter sp. TaxID=1965321 RepID=UPI002D15E21E|nr:SPOR domain-containing protein [Methyloceanibacter sp.]